MKLSKKCIAIGAAVISIFFTLLAVKIVLFVKHESKRNEWIKAAFKLQFKSFKKTYVAIFEVIENIDKFHILSQNTIQSLIVV